MNLFWKKSAKQLSDKPGYFRTPRILTDAERNRQDLERMMALAGIPLDQGVLKIFVSYADEHAANEQESALRPDLTDSQRQYNAGRAASALDFATAIRELHAQAQRKAAELKKKDE
jgi:hypothetical protein